MCAARAHLRTVRGQPTDFEPFAHAHFREKLAEEQDALSAKAGDFDFELFEVVLVRTGFRAVSAG